MKSNRELYKETFSKLHASGQPVEQLVLERKRYGVRKMRKSAVVCLAALGIVLAAATMTFAMTGAGPVEFFKSFFQNADSQVSETVKGSYVAVEDQSVVYGNVRIAFEEYSYTEDTLLAKFRVTPMEELQGGELEAFVRRLRFMADAAGSSFVDMESVEADSVVIAVRMGLDWADGEEDFAVNIMVMERMDGQQNLVVTFSVEKPSSMPRLVLDTPEIPNCKKVVISSINVKLYFDSTVSELENSPVRTLSLRKKDGELLTLFDKGDGELDEIVEEISFGWTEGEDGTMTIGFSRVLDLDDVKAVVINGEEYEVPVTGL